MSGLPKRFPDRVEIVAVRAEAEPLEPGQEAETKRRLAGRVMARRDMGKIVFLDLVDRSGRMQLLCPVDRTGQVDVDESSARMQRADRVESCERDRTNDQPAPGHDQRRRRFVSARGQDEKHGKARRRGKFPNRGSLFCWASAC